MMTQVTLTPGNALDFEEFELEELAAEVSREAGVQVALATREQRGRAVTWWEVVDFVVSEAGGEAVGAVVIAAVAWAARRVKKAREATPDRLPRPVWVNVYGPNGDVLKSVQVPNRDEEPRDVTEEERERQERYRSTSGWLDDRRGCRVSSP